MGIHSRKGDLKLSTVVMYGTEVHLENKWSWDKDEAGNKVPRLQGTARKEIKVGCQMVTRRHLRFRHTTLHQTQQQRIQNFAPLKDWPVGTILP